MQKWSESGELDFFDNYPQGYPQAFSFGLAFYSVLSRLSLALLWPDKHYLLIPFSKILWHQKPKLSFPNELQCIVTHGISKKSTQMGWFSFRMDHGFQVWKFLRPLSWKKPIRPWEGKPYLPGPLPMGRKKFPYLKLGPFGNPILYP